MLIVFVPSNIFCFLSDHFHMYNKRSGSLVFIVVLCRLQGDRLTEDDKFPRLVLSFVLVLERQQVRYVFFFPLYPTQPISKQKG